ncbi:hypothetical protein BDV40DRAFT_253346 [Aspergillus tamarii]|uniref:Uncharacterized protein n=1 Tax=Aspergillus tamarii TaxID=41984 RepID=A0A5N6V8D3_ASPTM|nr:hypothetical protein BDV40DRAFT_253346 [Aspergillus tamarii]
MYWYSKYPSVLGTLLLPILFSPYRTQVTLARHLNYSSKKRGKSKKERKKRRSQGVGIARLYSIRPKPATRCVSGVTCVTLHQHTINIPLQMDRHLQ